MIRNKVAVLCAIVSMIPLHATYKKFHERNILVELKGAYVLPAAQPFRHIYRTAGEVSAELTGQFKQERPWFGFASVGIMPMHGKSLGFCTKTHATLVPLTAGLKYFLGFNPGDMYVGFGVLGAHLKTRDYSSFVISSRSKWGVGGIGKLGFIFDISKSRWFADLFTEYGFINVNFPNKFECGVQSHKANVSHWMLGLGIGYRFA